MHRGGWNLFVPWLVWGTVCTAAMWLVPGQETIPYHLGYAGLALAAGLDAWSHPQSVAALGGYTLLTGAVLFGLVVLVVRPFTNVWLAHSLDASATRYGSIGVAFTYLAWLYLIAWIFLATAVIGQVLVTDDGRVGRWLAGPERLVRTERTDSVALVLVDDRP